MKILSKTTSAIFLLWIFGCSLCYAQPLAPSSSDPAAFITHEISRLDTLIQATQQSLEDQKKLRERIVEYKKLQDAYVKAPDDNDLLFRIVKSAHRTLQAIKENHLIHVFDPEFIDELTVLSQPAQKRGIPKP